MNQRRTFLRSLLLPLLILAVSAAFLVAAQSSSAANPNLVVNPSLETQAGAFPSCYTTYGYGTSNLTTSLLTTGAHTGTYAVQEVMSGYANGDWKLLQTQSTACAPTVTAGHTYTASVYYQSTTAALTLTAFKFSGGSWSYWTDFKSLPVASGYTQATAKTPAIPAGVTQISFGISLHGNGTLTVDDYSLVDTATAATPTPTATPKPTATPAPTATPGRDPHSRAGRHLHRHRRPVRPRAVDGADLPQPCAGHPHGGAVQRQDPVHGRFG